MEKNQLVFHFLGNAHLDPVWLWDKQEGLNEGIITCKMVIDLMDEFPELTFNRGESLIYEHIEKNDPALFRKILKYVETGRWDIVGGSYIQQDNNLPGTETMIRGFLRGQSYFLSRFGKISEVGWSADCFGHSAGLPDIMKLAEIKYFAFTRPNNELFPISKPAFYWIGQAGAKILCYRPIGWYGSERFEIIPRIEKTIETFKDTGIRNIGIFYGLGDHGGGPTRKQIKEILKWKEQNLDVKVIFSTMHRFFNALHKEILSYDKDFLPEITGELNFTLRGCYSSLAKLKFLYRKTQSQIISAEKTQSLVSLKLPLKKQSSLTKAWDILLFNAFHDILPGTSIERACEEQIYELGSAYTIARESEFNTLNILSQKINTTVENPQDEDKPSASPMLVWNPHPFDYQGFIEMETCLDWRPIVDYKGRADEIPVRILGPTKEVVPFQLVETESPRVMPDCPWRKRALIPVSIPSGGWSVFEMGW
ncbi:MAG TPA: alpha-mannosidase, partial [Victivallales bacterium]|nr:alpha-mannosidase [Victivallales bacterium]